MVSQSNLLVTFNDQKTQTIQFVENSPLAIASAS